VLDWSAWAEGTDVGVEYILMKRLKVSSFIIVIRIYDQKAFELTNQVNAMERVFDLAVLSQIGSLYTRGCRTRTASTAPLR